MANIYSRRKQQHQFKETGRVDPYRSDAKSADLPRCPSCRAVSVRGRWLPAAQVKVLATSTRMCPACKQLKDRYAQGVVELRGDAWKENKELVENTIHKTERIARARNDQERLLWTSETRGVTKVYVTLPELARRIGRELEKSFQGVAEYAHSSEEPYLRVRWWSDLPRLAHRTGSPLRSTLPSRARSALKPQAPKRRSRSFRGRGRHD